MRTFPFYWLNVGQWQSRINQNFLKNVKQSKLNENKRSFWIYKSHDIGRHINLQFILKFVWDRYYWNFEFLWLKQYNDSKIEYDFRVGLQNWNCLSFEGNFGQSFLLYCRLQTDLAIQSSLFNGFRHSIEMLKTFDVYGTFWFRSNSIHRVICCFTF